MGLSPIEAAAVAGVSDPRGWEALTAFHAHREPLEVTAGRWNIPRERVRQLGLKALQQLTAHARFQGRAAQLYELTQTPTARHGCQCGGTGVPRASRRSRSTSPR